jgi:hypothetical protein
MPDASVPAAESVPGYSKTATSVEGIHSFVRALNSVSLPLLMMLHKRWIRCSKLHGFGTTVETERYK